MSTGKLRIDGAGEIQMGANVETPAVPPFGYVSLYAQNGELKAQDWDGNITLFGSSGSSGSSGNSGTNGTSGQSGSSGSSGVSGSSGISGSSGTSGQNGTSGSSGQSGSSGSSGQSGSSGSSGSSGQSGSSGSSGSSGVSGSAGTSGSSGQSGSVYYSTSTTSLTLGNGTQTLIVATGLQFTPTQDVTILYPPDPLSYNMTGVIAGYDSNNGELIVNVYQTVGTGTFANWIVNLDGAVGAAGSSGTSGANGTSGTSGGAGVAGTSGTSGQNGTSGTSGENGTSGQNGTSGSSGESGTSGQSGTSGTSGMSGTSGTSGANGISSGQIFYFNQSQSSAVPPYKVLSPFPSGAAQQIVTTGLTNLQTGVLVQEFLTPELGFAVIPGGSQTFHFHFLKQGSNNLINAYATIELANSAGVGYGTVLTTGVSSVGWVSAGVPALVNCDLILPTTTINTTDRMIVKLYLNNLDNQVRSVDFYTEGSQYYSFIVTSVGVVASTSGTSGSSGQNGTSGSSGQNGTSGTSGTSQSGLNYTAVFSGSGAVITPGVITYIRAPRTSTITKVTLLADQTGSAVLDIYKDSYANFPPNSADSICGSSKPTLSSANKYEDSTLSTWTTSITAGDVLGFTLDSCSTITQITLQLETA